MAKDIRVPVSLNEAQHREISKAASRLGLTLSAFIRMAALEKANA